MRKSILLYLFCFAVLIAIFQYVSARNRLKDKNEEITALEHDLELAERKVDSLESVSQNYFSLEGNEDALSYFEASGIDASKIAQQVKDEIISRNKASADNDLVPFEGMNGPMRINKIKILNHKWIIADFTDGRYWGELFITYYIDDSGALVLNTEHSFLYPKN